LEDTKLPRVSVLMPSYNHSKYVSEAINSVLDQTLDDWEMIIVDDNSKDESQEILAKFTEADERIKVMIHEKNMGIAKTLNDCFKYSEGQYIAFIASDDVWMGEKLEKQVNVLESNNDLVVFSEGLIIDNDSNLTGERTSDKYKNANVNGFVFEDIINCWFNGSSMILKRENVKNIKFNEKLKYLNDTQFYMDIGHKYPYHFMEEPLSKYRLHETNSSHGAIKDIKGWYSDSLFLCLYVFDKYGDELSKKAIKNIFYKTCIVPVMIGINNQFFNVNNIIYPIVIPFAFIFCFTRKCVRKITKK
jgi:glycosyltransferase involved in cell wall biosynthesis